MNIRLVCPAKNVSFYESDTIIELSNGAFLSNNRMLLNELFLHQAFVEGIGTNNADVLFNSPFALYNYEIVNDEQIDLRNILESSWGPLQLFQTASWFVKDNSINFDVLFGFDPQQNLVISNRRNVWFSNSRGRYEDLAFDAKEFLEIKNWQSKIEKFLVPSNAEQPDIIEDYGKHQYRYGPLDRSYASMNRVSRALRFIIVGRSESFLPMKISANVGALESLFSTGHTEITHQIAERVAKFIGGELKKRITSYNIIKDVYSVRSSYVHGSGIGTKTLTKLEELSPKLDTLLREVMVILITKHEDFTSKSEKELKDWFLKLILE